MTQLQTLFVDSYNENITEAFLEPISKMQNLRSFLYFRELMTDVGVGQICSMKNLKFFCCSPQYVSDNILQRIQKELPECKVSQESYHEMFFKIFGVEI
jgi:hypothetical protein